MLLLLWKYLSEGRMTEILELTFNSSSITSYKLRTKFSYKYCTKTVHHHELFKVRLLSLWHLMSGIPIRQCNASDTEHQV